MGTFFKVYDLAEIEVSNETIFDFNEKNQPIAKRGTFVENWIEFNNVASIEYVLNRGNDNTSPQFFLANKEYLEKEPNAVLSALIVLSFKITEVLNSLLEQIGDQNQNKKFTFEETSMVPIINSEKFRNAAETFTDIDDVFGIFITEVKEEIPELISTLTFKDRRVFEDGITIYAGKAEVQSRQRMLKARQALEKAIIAEEEAAQITEEAHRKTDAALGAEATAEGLQRLTDHWQEKATHHQARRGSNFFLFSVVLALALAVLLLNQAGIIQSTLSHLCGKTPYCPSSWQQYWKNTALSANGSWVWALLSLKGFLLPVLGVAWLLRILSRQNAAHFALENDARQRLALLVSFVRLQELPETQLSEAERLLILNALFRPADATPSDAPPPNLTELLTKLKP